MGLRISDGATTRRERIIDMLRYIQTHPEGISPMKVQQYMGLMHGLKPETVGRYLHEQIQNKILEPVAGKLYLDEAGFNKWMEILGYKDPAQTVQCLKCGAIYSDRYTRCPVCKSPERKLSQEEEKGSSHAV